MDLPDGWTADTVSANGIDVHYYRVGEGPPLVLNHGITDDGRCWAPLAEDLRSDFDVVMPDARGHGHTESPDWGYGVADRVADLVGLLDALGLTDPILVGHSYGGGTVTATAARHPDRPRAVVLEDPVELLRLGEADADGSRADDFPDEVAAWAETPFEELAATFEERGRDPALARHLAAARKRLSPNLAAAFREGVPDAEVCYPEVTCPTLVLKADADAAARERHRDAVSLLPDGRIVHVEGAGHCVFRDRYEAAYAELRSFLDAL